MEENKFTVMIQRLLWEFKLHWEFMSTDENKNKNKMNLLFPSSTPVTVFLIADKP